MRLRLFVAATLVSLAAAAPAHADSSPVSIVDTAYMPQRVSVLAGDTVGWRNASFINLHTVTGSGFDSGPIVPGGGFYRDFGSPGTYIYACTIHPVMTGEVDVYRLLLSGPAREVAKGAATTLTGRAAMGVGEVTIEEDTGGGFHPVSTVPAKDGAFRATVRPSASASYRAVSGTDSSPPVSVAVSNRTAVTVSRVKRGLRVHVDPLNSGAKVSLQLKLRERFGWWTVARARLDKGSNTRFRIRRRGAVWARAVLTQSDGWTPLAASLPLQVRGHRR